MIVIVHLFVRVCNAYMNFSFLIYELLNTHMEYFVLNAFNFGFLGGFPCVMLCIVFLHNSAQKHLRKLCITENCVKTGKARVLLIMM